MIVQFKESTLGTPVYINPAYVVSMRPDLADPTRVTLVNLSNGEAVQVVGSHEEVANRLAEGS